jgi:hypothetical protein
MIKIHLAKDRLGDAFSPAEVRAGTTGGAGVDLRPTVLSGQGATAAPSKNYTVTKAFGPYNGAAKIGQPGSAPDGRALAVYCPPASP